MNIGSENEMFLMKALVKLGWAGICLIHFLLRMVWNSVLLYCHCFASLP